MILGYKKARGATRHDLVTSRYQKKAEAKGAASSSGCRADQREESSESYEDLGIEKRREEEKSGERELHVEKLSVERMHRLISGWTPNQKKSDRGRSRRKEQVPNHDVNPILIFHACVWFWGAQRLVHLHVWQLYSSIVSSIVQRLPIFLYSTYC